MSVIQSIRAISEAEVVVLVLTPDGLSDQDARLAALTLNQHKPLLIVVNKWDLMTEKTSNTMKEFAKDIRLDLGDRSEIPVLFTSCLQNKRVHKIIHMVGELSEAYHKRVATSLINECLAKAVRRHTPALIRKYNKRVKFYYATQVRSAPPTIVIKCNVAGEIQESYKRYLTRQFRETLGFGPVPLRIFYRGKTKREERREKEAAILGIDISHESEAQA